MLRAIFSGVTGGIMLSHSGHVIGVVTIWLMALTAKAAADASVCCRGPLDSIVFVVLVGIIRTGHIKLHEKGYDLDGT